MTAPSTLLICVYRNRIGEFEMSRYNVFRKHQGNNEAIALLASGLSLVEASQEADRLMAYEGIPCASISPLSLDEYNTPEQKAERIEGARRATISQSYLPELMQR